VTILLVGSILLVTSTRPLALAQVQIIKNKAQKSQKAAEVGS
jgi:hypothetical protein